MSCAREQFKLRHSQLLQFFKEPFGKAVEIFFEYFPQSLSGFSLESVKPVFFFCHVGLRLAFARLL